MGPLLRRQCAIQQVGLFVGICLQFVEFFAAADEPEQLELFVTQRAALGGGPAKSAAEQFIVDIPGPLGFLSQQREKAARIDQDVGGNGGGDVQAGQFENRGKQIDGVDQGGIGASWVHDGGSSDEQGHTDASFVKRALGAPQAIGRL